MARWILEWVLHEEARFVPIVEPQANSHVSQAVCMHKGIVDDAEIPPLFWDTHGGSRDEETNAATQKLTQEDFAAYPQLSPRMQAVCSGLRPRAD